MKTNHFIALLTFLLLFANTAFGQTTATTKIDSIKYINQENLDTLVKYIRNQFYQKNYDKTIQLSPNAITEAQALGNRIAVFRLSSLLGNAFLQVGDTTQARRIFNHTIKEAERLNDTTSNLTTARIDLGNIYALQEKHVEAIEHYKAAVPLALKLQDTTHLFVLHYSIGNLYLEMQQAEEAEYFVSRMKDYVARVEAKAYKAVAKLVEGRLLLQKGLNNQASILLEESITLAKSSGYSDALIEANEYLATAQLELANYKYAAEILQQIDIEKSKKYELDKIEAIESEVAKYKVAEYEQELKAQALQNKIDQQETRRKTTLLWTLIASGIVIISAVFLFKSYLKRKKLYQDLLIKNKQYLKAKEISEDQVKAKSRLFANITHELRTPLYGIIGITSLMMEGEKGKNNSDNLNALKFSAEYLLSLVNNVLQFTRINVSNISKSKSTVFHLGDLLHNVVDSAKYLNKSYPNSYQVNMDPEIPQNLAGDEVALTQILMNIVSNASKFTHDGEITINLTCKSRQGKKIRIKFEVIDTGIGIHKERQQHIFSEFAEAGSNYENQGSGLGLPIAKKLVGMLEGQIALTSEIQNGTCVTFDVVLQVSENTPSKSPTNFHADTILEPAEILVVDDNKINLLVTQKTLQKYGAKVHTALNGKDGIKIAQDTPLDLILMDINMPGMNGIEASHIIRSFNKTLPIVALTAVEKEKIILENETTPLDDFIIKPYRQDVFLTTILNHLQKQKNS